MRDLIFAFMSGTGEMETDSLRLARSIRTFGGQYCFNPIWMFSQRTEEDLSDSTRQELFSSGIRLITFDMDSSNDIFPFADYVTAASIAEGLAQGEASFLVMMATDTLILQTPETLLLSPGRSFGGCPVHLKLLGSGFDEAIDGFWQAIYRNCKVDLEHIFAMQTIVDEQRVRAYFNAGLLVVRPERGLLRAWKANFDNLYNTAEFEAFYQQHELYKIFMHQSVLAGSVLSLLSPEEIQQFPSEVNYPLHLHSRVNSRSRPSSLGQLITCRYEAFAETFNQPEVVRLAEMDPVLKAWIQAQ